MNGSKRRLMITGGSGLLGSNLARRATENFRVFATHHTRTAQIPGCIFIPLNITNRQEVMAATGDIKPDVIIHTAALVNVDYCQGHPDESLKINAAGTENMAIAAREYNAKLIYISTDSVFEGSKGKYKEEDKTNPVNVYAATKLEGERRIARILPERVIARTAFYGWSPINSQATSLAHWVVNNLREKKEINMFTDVFFSPIEAGNLAEALLEICGKNISGVYHVAGSERCSKYDFGVETARVFGLDESLIHPSSITEANLKAPRPRDISLDVSKIKRAIDTRLLNVKEGIARFRDTEKTYRAG
jgi:dTDP-4-dehydrorhamnose reductase